MFPKGKFQHATLQPSQNQQLSVQFEQSLEELLRIRMHESHMLTYHGTYVCVWPQGMQQLAMSWHVQLFGLPFAMACQKAGLRKYPAGNTDSMHAHPELELINNQGNRLSLGSPSNY